MNNLITNLSKEQDQIAIWRQTIHQHPELAFKEGKTAAYVAELLKEWGYEVHTHIGGTGVVASLTVGTGEKIIGLRADMDALPITEENTVAYTSVNSGVMHACGHDGHTAMLLGAAKYLSANKNFNGTVRLIFQPAEETMGGAVAMINDGLLERFPVDAMFGMHNMPFFDEGEMHFKDGPMMAAVDNLEIELTGQGGHGSMPEKTNDVIVAGAALVTALQSIVSRNVAPMQSAVVTIGAFIAGSAGNVIPESAILRLSIRSLTNETRELVLARIKAITIGQAESFSVGYEIRENTPGAVLINDVQQTAFAADVATQLLGTKRVSTNGATYMGSEDFAFFSRLVPSCYCIIGNGHGSMVHTPTYNFNDDILSIGAAYWVGLSEKFLQ